MAMSDRVGRVRLGPLLLGRSLAGSLRIPDTWHLRGPDVAQVEADQALHARPGRLVDLGVPWAMKR